MQTIINVLTRSELKKIILKQQEWLKSDPGIPRIHQIKIIPGRATIISGVRRCGKSTLALQLVKNESVVRFANFEDLNFSGFQYDDFLRLDETFHQEFGPEGIYFFDEIQNVPGWERYVRYLLDRGEKVLITGSNASMLSRELGTHLTGRHLTYELYPFSYLEYLHFFKTSHNQSHFDRYLKNGGFPEFLKYQEPQIITHLFHDIFYRDIMLRNDIRNETAARIMMSYILSVIGSETSFNKLRELTGAGSGNTIRQLATHFADAYLLFNIPRFDYSLRRQMLYPKKFYCVDNGIISTNAFQFSENKGRLLENMVFVELKRRGYEVFYSRGKGECDFLIRKQNAFAGAIQVCFELTGDNFQREIAGLLETMKTYHLTEGAILTYDEEDEFQRDHLKIRVQPIWKWLLEQ